MPKFTEIHAANLPTIALVGRVNVGKSTLFNTLIEEHKALVSDIAGTTRTSNEGFMLWRGKYVRLIDTGGLTFEDDIPLEDDILAQSEVALKQADLVLFVTDAQDGILPQEKELAKRLRKIENKPVLVIANKVDSKKIEPNLHDPDWSRLGLGEPFPISATSGRNVGDLLDVIFRQLRKIKKNPKILKKPNDTINISLIGKPNVGKSSIFNKLIGEDRAIVSDMAHTTREPKDTLVAFEQKTGSGTTKKYHFNFIDTAGIRRKAKVSGRLEREGVHRSIETVDESDIVLFVLDGTAELSSQDMQLGGLVERRSKSVVILLNKWDMAEDNSDAARQQVQRMVYSYFPHLDFAPILFVSGKTTTGIHKIFPAIIHAWQARHTEVANRGLEAFLEEAMTKHKPARGKGTRQPKLLGMRQINANPPIFELFVKYRTSLHRSYLNFLENRLREQFDFYATPIVIKLTKMKR